MHVHVHQHGNYKENQHKTQQKLVVAEAAVFK
jgi:hypothetical protein